MKQLRVEYKQTATFVSEVVELDHPKARPLLEVLFSKMLSGKEKGVKGDDIVEKISGIFGANKLGFAFTTNTRGEITGVRSQYIPDYRAEGLTEEEGEDIFNDAVDKVLEALEEAGIIAQANVWGVLTESYGQLK